jgi:hypothetical protein
MVMYKLGYNQVVDAVKLRREWVIFSSKTGLPIYEPILLFNASKNC